MPVVQHTFTIDAVDWNSWLPTIDYADATPEQIEVLKESSPKAATSPYYLLLAHDIAVLRQRSKLFNAIMYSHGGLNRADRELAAVATSRVNGCVYCASVHAIRWTQLRKTNEPMLHLLDEGVDTPLDDRDRALVDYAVKLTLSPNEVTAQDLEPLRQLGLSDLEILDATHVIAIFAWANRLLETLGEPIQIEGEDDGPHP